MLLAQKPWEQSAAPEPSGGNPDARDELELSPLEFRPVAESTTQVRDSRTARIVCPGHYQGRSSPVNASHGGDVR